MSPLLLRCKPPAGDGRSDFHSKSAGNRRADAEPPSGAPSTPPTQTRRGNKEMQAVGPFGTPLKPRPLNAWRLDSVDGEWGDPSVGSTALPTNNLAREEARSRYREAKASGDSHWMRHWAPPPPSPPQKKKVHPFSIANAVDRRCQLLKNIKSISTVENCGSHVVKGK